jgi:tRNA G18 (ribose-2'-O)-methylase SpoU
VPPRPLNIIEVAGLSDERLADYAGMRDAELRHRQGGSPGGRFMAEGELVVRRLVESAFLPLSVLLTPTRLASMRDALERMPEGTPIYLAPQAVMNSVVGFNMHRGVLACAERGPGLEAASLFQGCRLLVALENLTNHDNVGGIFRSAAALGGPGAGILLSPGCCDPLYRKSIRVSMGHVLRVPFATLAPWPAGLEDARRAGFRVVALAPSADAVPIAEAALPPEARVLLLLGAEGPGLTAGAMRAADVCVRIPMNTDVDSLNVAVAGAVALHAIGRAGVG